MVPKTLQNRARHAAGPHPTFARSGNGDQHIVSVKSTKIRSAGLGIIIRPRQEVSCSSRLSGAGVTHRADSVATMMRTETHTAWHLHLASIRLLLPRQALCESGTAARQTCMHRFEGCNHCLEDGREVINILQDYI